MSGLPRVAELGTIETIDGRSYQITPEDLLWLARAAKYEGGSNPAATLWTYAQRWALKRWRGSLAELVRAHSQPLNPRWDDASDPFCVEHPDRCTDTQLARRAQAVASTWADLGETAQLALAWAQARVPNPVPRATDFADAAVSTAFLERHPGSSVVLTAGNWYIAEEGAQGWPTSFVSIRYHGHTATTVEIPWWMFALGAGAIVLGGVGVFLARSR